MVAELLLSMMAVTATDQTVTVAKGTKLSVNNFAGDVIIGTWDKDAVRVEANHSDREVVDIKQGDQTLSVRSRSARGGPSRSLDYKISVPSWMSVGVSGTYADVTVTGVGGDVLVETTHGDITVRGGSGFVSVKSVQGEIVVEKAKGRIEVRSVNEDVRLADIAGDLSAESTNGNITLDRIDSSNVDLYTVNGNISYDGAVKDKGLYRLTTHNGLIGMPVGERANVTLSARTYNGSIRSTFALPGDAGAERRAKRLTVTLGSGSAHVELESFGGTIALRRPGEARPETERKRRDRGDDGDRHKAKDKGQPGLADLDLHATIAEAMAEAQAALPEAIDAATASIPGAIDAALASLPEAIDDAMASLPEALNEALESVGDVWPFADPHPQPLPRPNPRPRPR